MARSFPSEVAFALVLFSCSSKSAATQEPASGETPAPEQTSDEFELGEEALAVKADLCARLANQANALFEPFDEDKAPACKNDSECTDEAALPACGGGLCGVILHVSQLTDYEAALESVAPICAQQDEIDCGPRRVASCVAGQARCIEGRCQFSEGLP